MSGGPLTPSSARVASETGRRGRNTQKTLECIDTPIRSFSDPALLDADSSFGRQMEAVPKAFAGRPYVLSISADRNVIEVISGGHANRNGTPTVPIPRLT